MSSVEGVRTYLDELERHDVLRGGEFCWHDTLWREIPESLARRFTHRIGSLHAVFLADGSRAHVFARSLPKGEHVIEYNLRAQTPGSYHTLPTLVQAMYGGYSQVNFN